MVSAVSNDWKALNDTLRTAEETECRALLAAEQAGRARRQYLLRIHSRLNYVRAHTERAALLRGEAL